MAADVITRFKLETTQFDSKLRDTAKALQDIARTAANGGKDFNNFSQKAIDTARALGTVASGATNTKDRLRDLVGSYNDAVKAYDKLSDAAKNGEFGQAMAESLRKLQLDIKNTKEELYSLGDAVGGKSGGLFSGDKFSGMLQVFGGNLMTNAAGMFAGFASEIGDALKQGIELAKQGEGIRIAFERLGRGDILNGLREATHGTVTDLELMKAAVKFNDFRLPVEELGTMLAFAQQKAKDTGQSVDYMVDSIVTGLGRKSLMILDNLGLSASDIKERMAETGDMTKAVGEIIREQMSKAGDYMETAADRAAQANVSLQNKMEELGRKIAPLEEASNHLWTSMKLGILEIIGGPLTNLINKLTEAGRLMNAYSQMGGGGKVGRMTANLSGASEGNRQSIYQQQQAQFWKYINPREQQIKDIRAWQSGERGEALQGRINAIRDKYGSLDTTKIQAEVDAAKKMLSDYQQAAKTILSPVKADINTSDASTNLDSLKNKLKELEAQRKKAIQAGDTDLSKNLAKQINQVKSDIRGLDPSALKTSSSKNQPEYLDFYKALFKNESMDLKKEAPFQSVFDMMKDNNAKFDPESVLGQKDAWDNMKDTITGTIGSIGESFDNLTSFTKNFDPYQNFLDQQQEKLTGLKKGWQMAASAINLAGNAMSGLKNPAIDIMTVIGQAVATIGLAYAQTLAEDSQSKSNIYAFIAAASAATISMATTIASLHSATGYAQGGEIKGNSYSGDNIGGLVDGSQLVGLNAGEIVLNHAQQANLANSLQGGGFGNMQIVGVLDGETIKLCLNRHFKRSGEGELVTWGGH